MALQGNSSGSQGSHYSASPSASSVASGAASPVATSFSVFQEGPGQALVFSPPRGTPELQRLVDLFITLDIPASMKMDMIQRDFETHSQRTGERYKIYFVPAAAAAATATTTPTSAIPSTAAIVSSPATLTASPSPMFPSVFDTVAAYGAAGSVSGGSASGSGSLYLDASPAPRSSPSESELTDPLFPLSVPMIPTNYTTPSFHSVAQAASSSWPALTSSASSSSLPRSHAHHQERRQTAPRRRLSGSGSMQILTRTGEDVTHVSSRSTRTREERENTRLVRQRGACPECRRKKVRCNPGHVGSSFERVDRATPYAAPAQSGRAREVASTARAAKAARSKAEGKRPAAQPATFTPQPFSALDGLGGGGGGTGGGGGGIAVDTSAWNTFEDSFDWSQLSNQGSLFTDEELELEIAASLTAAEAASSLLAEVSLFNQTSTVNPPTPQPRVPGDSRTFAATHSSQAPRFATAAAAGGEQHFNSGLRSGLAGGLAGVVMPVYTSSSSQPSAQSSSSSSSSSSVQSSPTQSALHSAQQYSNLAASAGQQDTSRVNYSTADTGAAPALASQQLFSFLATNTGQSDDFGGFGGFGGFSSSGVFTDAGLADAGITGGDTTGGDTTGRDITGGDILGGGMDGFYAEGRTGKLSSGGLASGLTDGLSDIGVSGGIAETSEQGGLESGPEFGSESGLESGLGSGLESGVEGDSSGSSETSQSSESYAQSRVRGRTESGQQQQQPEISAYQRLRRRIPTDLQSGGSGEADRSRHSGGLAGLTEAAGSSSGSSSDSPRSLPSSVSSQAGVAANVHEGESIDSRDIRRRRPRAEHPSASASSRTSEGGLEGLSTQQQGGILLQQLPGSPSSASQAGDGVAQGAQLSTEGFAASRGSSTQSSEAAAVFLAGMASLVSSLLPSLLVWAATHPSRQTLPKYRTSSSLAVACH